MRTKEELVKSLIKSGCLKSDIIIEAFYNIDRKDFVLEEYLDDAYENHPLPIGFGQTISQPLTVAFMLELLEPKRGEKIMEIGAGSGWQASLLAYCVSKDNGSGRVFTIERIPELKEISDKNISKYNFIKRGIVSIILGDGSAGYKKEQPYDKIITAASAKHVMVAWKNQLKVGGRIVAPVGNSIEIHRKLSQTDYDVKEYKGFSFVPLVIENSGDAMSD